MAPSTITSLLTLSLLASSGFSFSLNPFKRSTKGRLIGRASKANSDELNYPFFVNCWASPGARSEVDWFSTYPTNFGSATPPGTAVQSENENYPWEEGGATEDPTGGTLSWSFTNKNASTNAQAGTATDGKLQYMILRDTDSLLYKDNDFNCIVAYRLQMISGGTATTSEPPSSNSTQPPTTTSSTPAAAAATTTAAAGGSSGSSGFSSQQQSSGLSSSAQVGIGVGVGVGGLLLLAAIGYFLWRRHQRRARAAHEPLAVDGAFTEKNGYPAGGAPGTAGGPPGTGKADAGHYAPAHLRAELGGQHTSELPGQPSATRAEVDGASSIPPQELDAGDVRR